MLVRMCKLEYVYITMPEREYESEIIENLNKQDDLELLTSRGLLDMMAIIGKKLESPETPFEEACIYLDKGNKEALLALSEQTDFLDNLHPEFSMYLDKETSSVFAEWTKRNEPYLEYDECLHYYGPLVVEEILRIRNIELFSYTAAIEQKTAVMNFAIQTAYYTTQYAQERQELEAA